MPDSTRTIGSDHDTELIGKEWKKLSVSGRKLCEGQQLFFGDGTGDRAQIMIANAGR
jgi:hypothetical protein